MIIAACVLHNFVLSREKVDDNETDVDEPDTEEAGMPQQLHTGSDADVKRRDIAQLLV